MPRESMRDLLERSRLAIRWGGILGLLCHPIYYVVWTYVLPQPYDNLFLRLSAAVICIPLIFQARWPQQQGGAPFWLVLYSGLIAFNVFSETVSRAPDWKPARRTVYPPP